MTGRTPSKVYPSARGFHEEGADAALAFGDHFVVGDREDHRVVRVRGVCDPLLAAVEHPVVAVPLGARLDRPDVRARIRFAEREADHFFACRDGREIVLPYGFAHGHQHVRRPVHERRDRRLGEKPLGPGDQRPARPVLSVQRLLNEDHSPGAHAPAADALRREHRVVAGLGRLHPHLSLCVNDLFDRPALFVEELPLVIQKRPVLLLERQDLRVHELVHACDGPFDQITNVLGDTDVSCCCH